MSLKYFLISLVFPTKTITFNSFSEQLISSNDFKIPFGDNQQDFKTLLFKSTIFPVVIPFKNLLLSFPVIEKQSNFSSQNCSLFSLIFDIIYRKSSIENKLFNCIFCSFKASYPPSLLSTIDKTSLTKRLFSRNLLIALIADPAVVTTSSKTVT